MTKTVLVLRHKTTQKIERRDFKAKRGEIRRLRRSLKNYELIDVEGDSRDPIVIFLRKDLEKYKQDPSSYLIDRKGIMQTASKVTGQRIELIGSRASKILNKFRRKNRQ